MHSLSMMAEISPGQAFLVQVLGFAVLVAVIVKLALPVLGKILNARTTEIEETFKKIDQDTQETSKRLGEIKEQLARLNQESQRRLEAALADAEKTKAQLLADTAAQVQATFSKLKNEIQIERDKAILELRHAATSLTMQAADYLVQATMNEPIHGRIVDKYLVQLNAVKKS